MKVSFRKQRILVLLLWALLLCCSPLASFAAGNETVGTLPASSPNASSYAATRTMLQTEIPAILTRYFPNGWVYSGGSHATSGTMVSAAFATEAFTSSGNRVTSDGAGGTVAINYTTAGCAAADTAWVIISAMTPNASGNFARVGSSNYFVNCTDAAAPSLPADSAWLMKVTIAGSAITVVTDLASHSPSGEVNACAYGSLNEAVTAVGTTTRTTFLVTCELYVTGTLSVPANIGFAFRGMGILAATSAVTVTVAGDWSAPNRQVVSTNVTLRLPTVDQINPRWFGAVGDCVADDAVPLQRAIETAQATGSTQINASVVLGAGCFLTTTQLNVINASNGGISIIGSVHAAKQQGSVRPISIVRFSGGATPVFNVSESFTSFYNFAIENTGTATEAILFNIGGREQIRGMSFILGNGATRFSRAAIRYVTGTNYAAIAFNEFTSAAPAFIEYAGLGGQLHIDRNVVDATTEDMSFLIFDASAGIESLYMQGNTMNSQGNFELLAIEMTSIGAGIVQNIVFHDNEMDLGSTTAAHRGMKLKNVESISINNNNISGGGQIAAWCNVTNSTVHAEGNTFRSIGGPAFDFMDTTSRFFPGNNNIVAANVVSLGGTTGLYGIVQTTYATTVKLMGHLGRPGGHTVFVVDVTDGVAFSLAYSVNNVSSPPGHMTMGQIVTVLLRNISGGAMGAVSFPGAQFKIAGAFTTPANGFSRSITFVYYSAYLVELWRGAADVSN